MRTYSRALGHDIRALIAVRGYLTWSGWSAPRTSPAGLGHPALIWVFTFSHVGIFGELFASCVPVAISSPPARQRRTVKATRVPTRGADAIYQTTANSVKNLLLPGTQFSVPVQQTVSLVLTCRPHLWPAVVFLAQ